MKLTIHKWVLNAIAAPNPTPMSKTGKYTVQTKNTETVKNNLKCTKILRGGEYILFDICRYWNLLGNLCSDDLAALQKEGGNGRLHFHADLAEKTANK